MNKRFLLLCTSLTVIFATFPQNYKAFIKHIVTEEQTRSQAKFEHYVSEIKEKLQHSPPLSNKEQQKLDSLLNRHKALIDEISNISLHQAFLHLLHQKNAISTFSSLSNLREALQATDSHTTPSQQMLEENLAQVDRQIEEIAHLKQETPLLQDSSWLKKAFLIAAGFALYINYGWGKLKHFPFFTRKPRIPRSESPHTGEPSQPFNVQPLSHPSPSVGSPSSLELVPYLPSRTTTTSQPSSGRTTTVLQTLSSWLSIVNPYKFFVKRSLIHKLNHLFLTYHDIYDYIKKTVEELEYLKHQDIELKEKTAKILKSQTTKKEFEDLNKEQQELQKRITDIALKLKEDRYNLAENFKKGVKDLIQQGADINTIDMIEGKTPLMFAVLFIDPEDTKLIQFLLNAGAKQSIDTNDNNGETALSLAAHRGAKESGSTSFVKILLANGAKTTAIQNNTLRAETENYIKMEEIKIKNYYDILRISNDATSYDITKAYRKLAQQFHPDKALNNAREAEAQFKEISEAYQALSAN
jgi:ankyrin repeat protein